jgi:hypothetical protein
MIFPKVTIGLLCAISLSFAAEPESNDKDSTLIYRAETPNTVWNGWGYASPLDPDLTKPKPQPEEFDLVETDGNQPRTFSGKVVGPESMKGIEIGLVSLVGIHWNNPNAYQWAPVAADGSFSITDARYNDASNALVVRGPNNAWTFLRYNFAPGKSGMNIVLKSAPSKKVRVTASGADMQDLGKVAYEAWPAVAQIDDQGTALRRQRLGPYNTSEEKFMDLVLPIGKVALFVKCMGWAGYYQIIDTTKADHFHFVLRSAGKMKIRTLDADGKPETGMQVDWINPAAPLSLGRATINNDGVLFIDSLVPGNFHVTIGGVTQLDDIEVQEGHVTEIVLQDGKDAVISRTKVESADTAGAASSPSLTASPKP